MESKKTIPALFVGHGSPMNAIATNEFTAGWSKSVEKFEKPNAILCISAHWETNGTFVTAMEKPKTIHDFGGFPKELYEIQYPAPGSIELAEQIKNMIKSTQVKPDFSWGLDHGCWSVIKHMYPNADVPIVQLSLDYTKDATFHFQLGKEIAPLREQGILIIASGNMVHNLRKIDWQNPNGAFDWAFNANEGLKQLIVNQNFEKLCKYKSLANEYQLAIPTPEHFLPLLYVLGLKSNEDEFHFFNDSIVMGSIAMTSLIVQ